MSRVKYIPALIDFLPDDSWLPDGSFDARLYRFRAQRRWSLERMAKWLGKNERSVRKWEDGRYPDPAELAQIDGKMAAYKTR
ncbi:helix-turn-helix transcriptional regulator [uncultured Maricaulis sp.]|uniref:helix-turn-helix domain-containing protein n=1 Tax=uncultured Maricaulis sp. TaxID=174710 RepID=UPI0030DD46EC|tara:strand:- start:6506 stop:6751 length:246 start_codon:yes stop_codon:yes gene_type:complete